MNAQTQTRQSLKAKLTTILTHVDQAVNQGASLHFGMLRSMLGQHRIMILPSVKNYTEHPSTDGMTRVTVVVEVVLLDGESDDQLTTRWIGQAVDVPELCYERAITCALEDFLQKTFLITQDDQTTPTQMQGAQVEAKASAESAIRRRPQGASDQSPVASPSQVAAKTKETKPNATNTKETVVADAPEKPTQQSIFVSQATDEPANEDQPDYYADQKAWKAANALWRALVAEVCSSAVMAVYEAALEQQEGVDSWTRIDPDTIRQWCAALRRRSSLPSDVRKLSDREEYILSQLPYIPRGSSLDRVEEEMRRLVLEVVSVEEVDAFQSLYLEKMNVEGLEKVAGRALIAMCRKLRRLKDAEREAFIMEALGNRQAA